MQEQPLRQEDQKTETAQTIGAKRSALLIDAVLSCYSIAELRDFTWSVGLCALITACTSAWSTICRNQPLECRCFANAATLCLIKNATCTRVQQTRVAAQMCASRGAHLRHICASPGADVGESRRRCADLLIERPAVHAVAVPCGEVHKRQCKLRRQQRVGRHDDLGRQQVRLAPAEACRHIVHLRPQLLLHADGSAEKSQRNPQSPQAMLK